MKEPRGTSRSERGYAALLAVFVALMAMTAAALLAAAVQHRGEVLRAVERSAQLGALADAGLAHALAELSLDPAWRGEGPVEMAAGTYTVSVVSVGYLVVEVTVDATYRHFRRRVRATVEVEDERPRVTSWRRVPIAAKEGRSRR